MAKFQMYSDKRGEFRWRFRADNGKIIAISSESYKSADDCKHALKLIQTKGAEAKIEVEKAKPAS